MHVHKVPYMTKFSLDKNFTKPSYLCIAEIFGGINFRQCSKGRHILNVIINIGQKICAIKILPIRTDGQIGENLDIYGMLVLRTYAQIPI